MSKLEATGSIHAVFDTKQVSERFTKREFVVLIADNPKYPQLVLFQATGDRCAQLDEFREGDAVRIEFNLRGREWKSPSGEVKFFTTLDAWRIDPVGERRAAPASSAPQGGGATDDIPF
jgi:hypothetical protein